MEKEFFELLGLGVPFYLGAATYGVFAWLDNNASDEATKVISSWLHGRSRNKIDLGNLIISAFDRIYTSPLLRFRAFRRSAAISSGILLVVFIIPWCASNHFKADISSLEEYSTLQFTVTDLIANLAAIVVTDYVSLLFVRRFINAARKRPIVATLLSLLVGFAVVVIGIFVFNFLWMIMIYLLEGFITNTSYLLHDTWVVSKRSFDFGRIGSLSSGMLPAFIIHLWLPLFALSSVVVKLLYLIFRAVEWAQWFLKQGNAHPFRAIGVVATIIVFGSAMLVKEGRALLGVLERS